MSVPPIHLNTDHILRECKQLKTGVLLIIAPTGTGKTMGMKSLIISHKKVYGDTIMVQPTHMARNSVQGVRTMTAQQIIQQYLKLGKFGCRTLIIDEVHTLSVEYHTLLSILQKTQSYLTMRIILMSATPNVSDLRDFFPMRVYETPVSSPFIVKTLYEPMEFTGYPPYRLMVKQVLKMLKKYPNHQRVLVFLYTHDQCDKMAIEFKDFAVAYNQGKTMPLYGGMDKNDMDEWNQFLQNEKNFIVFATNVAETSITIPNLSFVIDFGVRCIQRNNRIVYNDCPKSNMVQRAGRTGRTCPGIVVRCMTEDDFKNRRDRDNPEYNWDLMVLLMLRHHKNPQHFLPSHVHIQDILRKFRFYRVIDNEDKLDLDLVSFILKSPLLLKNSCHLYHVLKTCQGVYHEKILFYILSTALIDQMESRMSRIYYYSYEMDISRYKFFEKLKRVFSERHDELVIYINILVSCILNEKPIDFSNAFSLNFRSIRQISSAITRLWFFTHRFLGKETQLSWHDAVRDKFTTTTELDFNKKNTFKILLLKHKYIEQLRQVYFTNPLVPKLLIMNDMVWRPNFIVEYYNCIISPFYQVFNHNRCILLLSYDDTEIDKWFHPTTPITDIVTLSFSLYTFPPQQTDSFIRNISEHVKLGSFLMNTFKKKKQIVRRKFRRVMDDIDQDVAFRPGFMKMTSSIDDFLTNLSFFSEKIKNCF